MDQNQPSHSALDGPTTVDQSFLDKDTVALELDDWDAELARFDLLNLGSLAARCPQGYRTVGS